MFLVDKLHDGDRVDVLGALALSRGIPLPHLHYRNGAHIDDSELAYFKERLIMEVPKLTPHQLRMLQVENDMQDWKALKKRLTRLGLWTRVSPYHIHEPDGEVRRIEDAVTGSRRGGHWTTDRTYTPIKCAHCKKQIHFPGAINGKGYTGKWEEIDV